MKDYEFKKRLAYAITLQKQTYYKSASELLDLLADALLYADAYNKELDDALHIVYALYKKKGKETTKFLCLAVRDDREQEMTCSLSEELLNCLQDTRQERNEENEIDNLIKIIAKDKKLLEALKKNASSQYINRLLASTPLCAKGAKLKKFYKLTKHLF